MRRSLLARFADSWGLRALVFAALVVLGVQILAAIANHHPRPKGPQWTAEKRLNK